MTRVSPSLWIEGNSTYTSTCYVATTPDASLPRMSRIMLRQKIVLFILARSITPCLVVFSAVYVQQRQVQLPQHYLSLPFFLSAFRHNWSSCTILNQYWVLLSIHRCSTALPLLKPANTSYYPMIRIWSTYYLHSACTFYQSIHV